MLYAYVPYKQTMRWEYVGRCRSHHAPVSALVFGESPSGQTRLLSVGADGRVAEYDLAGSSVAAGLRVAAHHDFPPGSGAPTSMCFAPPLQYFRAFSAETHLLLSGGCAVQGRGASCRKTLGASAPVSNCWY